MLKLLFAAAISIQVLISSSDTAELTLWLPGLVIGTVGLLLGDKRYFCVNDFFFILFLVLFVAAPADQLEGRRFLGDISVRGIDFPEHVVVRTVLLADLFAVCVLLVKFLDRLPGKIYPTRWPQNWNMARPAKQASLTVASGVAIASEPITCEVSDDDDLLVVDTSEAQLERLDEMSIHKRRIMPHAVINKEHVVHPMTKRMQRLLGGFLVVELLMLAFMVYAMGSTTFILDGRDYPHRLYENNPALAVITQAFLQVVPLVGLVVGIFHVQAHRSRQAIYWLLLLIVGCLIFNNPFNTARFQFGAYCLMVLLFIFRGHIRSYLCYLGLVSYLMVIMPAMNAIRHAGTGGLNEMGELTARLDFKQLDYDAFSMFACAVFRTGDSGFAAGTYTLSVILFFIPRTLWPDKPLASSIELGQFLMQHHSGWFDNLSCPPFGDFYMDFGTFGVVCGGLLYGFILLWSDRALRKWEANPFFSCGLAAAVMGFLPILVRGSLGSVVGGFVVMALVLMVTSRLMRAPVITK